MSDQHVSGERKSKQGFPKRKAKLDLLASRKRHKIQHTSVDGLPWKLVSRPSETGLDGDDGILELEEVENVEVVYEETERGRVMKFNVRCMHRAGPKSLTSGTPGS